jgi:hypothetical protein
VSSVSSAAVPAFHTYSLLWKTLTSRAPPRSGGRVRQLGAPRTVIEDLAKLKGGEMVPQARDPRGRPEKRITLRCATEPDDAQAVLL